MKKIKHIPARGYTLLETVIYVAIFITILVVVIDMLVTLSRSFARVQANNQVRIAGMNAMERMMREIRTAESRDPGSTSDDLILNTTDNLGSPKTVEFYLDDVEQAVYLVDGGVNKGALTGSSTNVTALTFYNNTSVEGEAIKIEMTVQSKKRSDFSANFYTTTVMRGGY